MPRIVQYENKENINAEASTAAAPGLSFVARSAEIAGQEKAAAIGQGVRAARQGLDVVEQHVAQSETSKLSADFATAQAELTTQWNETARKADPNDHEVADRFLREVVTPRLEGIGGDLLSPQAQAMYQKASAGLKADLFQKTMADQATLAGNAAIVNLDTVKNQLSQTVRVDPSSFKSAITMANLTTEGLVQAYGLSRDKALQLGMPIREEIAKSAFIGMADKNPAEAMAALNRGEFSDYFDGTTAKTMQNYAEQQQHAALADAKAAEAEQRRQEKDRFDAASAAVSASVIDPQSGDMRIPPDYFKTVASLAQMPQADGGQIRAMISAGHAVMEDQAKGVPVMTDPNVYENFAQRMLLPSTDPNALTARDVYAARTQRHISDHDMNFFLEGMKGLSADPAKREADKQFNFFLSTQKSAFTGTNQFTGFRDPKGDQKYYAFATAARQQYEAAYAKGGDAWKKLLTPGDQSFVGKMAPQFIQNKKGADVTPSVTRIGGDADYAKLPHGAVFVGPDNVQRVKP